MAKFFSLMLFCFSVHAFFAQVQTVEDDFEGEGTINSWFGDDCGIDVAFANPYPQGLNTSQTVLKYNDLGGQYSNIRFDTEANFDLSNNHTFSFNIYVESNSITGNQNNQVSLKLQDGTVGSPWETQSEIIKNITLDQWQEVVFDFENDAFINFNPGSAIPLLRTDFNRIVIQVNDENNNDLVTAYIDDFNYDGTVGSCSVFNTLVWSDEFEVNGPIDGSKWFHQTQLPNGWGWYNGELQHYTDRVENSYIENGYLHIVAKDETYTDQGVTKEYTSARLNSKFAFTHGRVESRAKMPFGIGTWPAIWMLGKNINEAGAYWQTQGFGTTAWPACGEIDILEHWGSNQNYVQSALHTPSSSGATVNHGGTMSNDVSNTFHIYAMEWTEDKIDFSVDGFIYYTYQPSPQNMSTWPFIADQFILLNVAIQNSIDPAFTSSDMILDYIRVYQEQTESVTTDTQSSCDSFTWVDGNTYTASNTTATYTLPNIEGCDSTLILDLTINNSYTGIDAQTSCDTYLWVDGVSYIESNNTATQVFTSAQGCDSIITLNLTLNESSSVVLTEIAEAVYLLNGVSYDSSGTYTQVIENVAGCDSTITLNLLIDSSVGLNEGVHEVIMYPNPAQNTISISSDLPIKQIVIYDLFGKTQYVSFDKTAKQVFDISALSYGVYYVQVITQDRLFTFDFLKL